MNQTLCCQLVRLLSIYQHRLLFVVITIVGSWWCWQFSVLRSVSELFCLAVIGALMLCGFVTLGWLQSAHARIVAPQTMLLLGIFGMLIGLGLDSHRSGPAILSSICRSDVSLDFLSTLNLHWTWLPAMHIGMVVGGITTIPLLRISNQHRRQFCVRIFQNFGCSVSMIVGMTTGALVYQGIYQHIARFSLNGDGQIGMLGGMFVGMVWGMVANVAIYRLYFSLQAKRISWHFLSS